MGGGKKNRLRQAEKELERARRESGLGAGGMTIAHALHGETDRGCALVAGEFLNDALEVLLRTKFEKEKTPARLQEELVGSFMAILGSLAYRATACRAFGLIDQDRYEAIDNIREIRNACGHRPGPIDLQDQEVAKYVHWLAGFVSRHPVQMEDGSFRTGALWWNDDLDVSHFSKERITFMDAASITWMILKATSFYLKRGVPYKPWGGLNPTAPDAPQPPQE